eukprot:4114938-Pyramimonas_sp.AAC.1
MWRCRDLKLSRTLSNYDGTNAFASTDRGHLRALHSAQHYEPNIELCKHAVDDLVVHAHGIDGDLDMKPARGTTMGHAMAAGDFIAVYTPQVQLWNQQLGEHDHTHT